MEQHNEDNSTPILAFQLEAAGSALSVLGTFESLDLEASYLYIKPPPDFKLSFSPVHVDGFISASRQQNNNLDIRPPGVYQHLICPTPSNNCCARHFT